MHYFRNLTVLQFPPSCRAAIEDLEQHAAPHRLKPLGGLELERSGFVSPFGRRGTALTHRVGEHLLFCVGSLTRLLPNAVVREAVQARIDDIAEREGRQVGGRERRRLKDEVLTDLIPRAFARSQQTWAYFDLSRGWLVVDTASRKVAEAVVARVRDALGSFPALPLAPETSPRLRLTAWLANEALPAGLQLGDESELRDPSEQGGIVKLRRHELDGEEVQEHLRAGKVGVQLAVTLNERVSFVCGEDLVVRRLKFLDIVETERGEEASPDAAAELDATFAILAGEIRPLIECLSTQFGVREAA
jgi:recombination associated protein RdgC